MATSVDQLKAAMRRFSLENHRFDDAVARRLGISPAELHALEHLEISGGMTPGQLGERLQLTSGAVTALADRLEGAGLLARVAHPSDRRSSILCLTERAERFGWQFYGPFGADLQRAAAGLTASERAVVARFMDACAEVAAEHAARQGSAGAPSSSSDSDG